MSSPIVFVPAAADGLAMALLRSSQAPLLLLDERLDVVGASASFCREFGIDGDAICGKALTGMGNGEWNVPQLESLLRATFRGQAAIDAYEMDLTRPGAPARTLVINA